MAAYTHVYTIYTYRQSYDFVSGVLVKIYEPMVVCFIGRFKDFRHKLVEYKGNSI